jgi:hypothetical protein
MSEEIKFSLEDLINRLNSMVLADREAIIRLLNYRVPCNDVLAEHPTAQVSDGYIPEDKETGQSKR